MPYNDEQTRKDEALFQQQLQIARSISKEQIDQLMQSIEILAESIRRLAAIPEPTAEELDMLDKSKKMLLEVTDKLTYMQSLLGESTKRQAYAFFHHVKKLAEAGNADARQIYEDLKPGYQAALSSELGEN